MTENHSRRTFVKGIAATGTAATGVAAFGGSTAAQEEGLNVNTGNLNITEQNGEQQAEGLIVVQAQNVALQDVVEVTVGDDVVNIEDVEVLNENVIQVAVADAVDVEGTQVAVTVLGETEQGQQLEGTDTVQIGQGGQTGGGGNGG